MVSLYFHVQDLRDQQRVAEEIVTNGITLSHLPFPTLFTGDCREYREFIVFCQVALQSYPRLYTNDQLHIGYIVSHLSGLALEWAKVMLQATHPLIEDFPGFLEAMSNAFVYLQAVCLAEEAMFAIRQRDRPTIVYITKFQSLIPTLDWPDEIL